jgi:hypothetical protein
MTNQRISPSAVGLELSGSLPIFPGVSAVSTGVLKDLKTVDQESS